eukprot:SAG22_NODE_7234_length_759_cov_1.318182_1_plen_135_part_00
MVAGQLRSAGLVAAVEISRVGFPSRLGFGEFARSFRVLIPPAVRDAHAGADATADSKACAEALLVATKPDLQLAPQEEAGGEGSVAAMAASSTEPWLLGKTKVFFQAGMLDRLAALANRRLGLHAVAIQTCVRR